MLPDLIKEIDVATKNMRKALDGVKPEERLAIEQATLTLLKVAKQLLENDARILAKLWKT